MSSQTAQTFADQVFKSKMPLYDGTVTSAGRSKPPDMSGFLSKQALQYSRAYFTFDPRGKDGVGFSPWTGSKTCLPDSRSPVGHLPGMEGQTHVIYRQDQDVKPSEEKRCHSPPVRHTPGKQGYGFYVKSPATGSPTVSASLAARKQVNGGGNASPPPENSVYLAIPKPIYVHSPCCNGMGCVLGQRYAVERGCQRIPNTVYESEWMPSGAQRPPVQRKAPDARLQQRGLHYETNTEQSPLTYCSLSPGRARTLPTYIEPNYSSYPCTPPRSMLGPLSEQRPHLQTPPRGYHSLYPSHPTYEHMTAEVYQARSPMSKYGPLTQHPMFYYPQASVEVESRTPCKDKGVKKREDVPVILKTPQEHYVPQSIHGEIPLPSKDTLPNHSLSQGYDFPCYAVPRFPVSPSQMRDSFKKLSAPPGRVPMHVGVPPSHQHMAGPLTSANLHKGHLKASLLHPSPPFLHMDQPSSSRHLDRPVVSPASMQIGKTFPPLGSPHIDRPRPSPGGLNIERLLNLSPSEAQATRPKHPHVHTPEVWPPQSPNHFVDSKHRAGTPTGNVRKIIICSPVGRGREDSPSAFSPDTTVHKGSGKRSIDRLPPSVKIKEENGNSYETGPIKKRRKAVMDAVKVNDETDSPPMPVIDNVFSLAAYKGYLQTSGVLSAVKAHRINVQSPERDGPQPHASPASKQKCPNTPTHKSVIQVLEPKHIKVEKVEPQDEDHPVEIHSLSETAKKDCSKKLVKRESKETASSDSQSMFVIKKGEPDELESRERLAVKDETSDVSRSGEQKAETGSESSFQGDDCPLREERDTPQPRPTTPLQPPESKLSFRNIPPQCLKLSAFNIVLPDRMHPSSIPAPVKPPAPSPKFELHMPVRKHFFELHQSLCKLISKCVSASVQQDLRAWLSQLKMTEHASPLAKVQKVSCLLGVRARHLWLNGEIDSALKKVLERLREYNAMGHCPFPQVMRTGAVFLPMLVLKELLFPHVQSSFIDQVLQEHKVELRPATLSEEKVLIQLHKRACSSKLRRLMSIKHLPDVYSDVVNLFYHASVCKHLESSSPDVQKSVQD
ncbi:uncharacterized protein C15orf39 homolog [Genypterus blacodes]|uniref:uncharacterized protein C15orf39 homolog n=1 Tax=Genypterus blacodes TaxID=154954 RepID=UPI003F7673A0